jgi:hypothetical protein
VNPVVPYDAMFVAYPPSAKPLSGSIRRQSGGSGQAPGDSFRYVIVFGSHGSVTTSKRGPETADSPASSSRSEHAQCIESIKQFSRPEVFAKHRVRRRDGDEEWGGARLDPTHQDPPSIRRSATP